MTGYKNCHAVGLTSIVLSTKSDGSPLLRVFIAEEKHHLFKNDPQLIAGDPYEDGYQLSVAFHKHRTNSTLIHIFGDIYNTTFSPDSSVTRWERRSNKKSDDDMYLVHGNPLMKQFIWHSPLLGEKGEFKSTNIESRGHISSNRISRANPITVYDNMYHSVYVPANAPAAWFVLEGDKNQFYTPDVWSNSELNRWKSNDYYQHMTSEEIEKCIRKYKINI